MMNAKRLERGQALVLIILSIVAIFGFAALAVDMGRIYAERRRAQNAADAAALAAAYSVADYKLEDPAVIHALLEQAALASVAENGFYDPNPNIEGDSPDIDIQSPPTHGEYEECDCQYIQVTITSKMDPIFAQFVFKGDEQITSEAIARGRRNTLLSRDNAVHALSTDADAVEFDGGTSLDVKGGNVYSNGGGLKNGTPGVLSITGGKLRLAQSLDCNGSGCLKNVKAKIENGVDKQNVLDVPMPYCPDANETVNGVNYYVHNGISSATTLAKGIHCVDGDIKFNTGTLKGDGVLIVMKNGAIRIGGNANVNLKRLSDVKDKYGHSYNGMLIYMARNNTNEVSIEGNSNSWFSGTIFAPQSMCTVGGTSGTAALHTSIICDKVKFHGNAATTIVYKNNENFQMQPLVELIE